MATRASIIAKAQSDMSDLGAGISATDSAGIANHFYYGLNDACSRVQVGTSDGDLASITNDQVRILSLATQYYTTRSIVKKYISIPRVDQDLVSRDNFARVMEFLRFVKQELEEALSGSDIPPEVSRPSESVVTWATGFDGGSGPSEGNNQQKRSGDFFVDEFGVDRTDYTDDET